MERERGIAVEKTSRQQSHHAQGHHVVGLSAELRCRAVGGGEEGLLFDHAGKRHPTQANAPSHVEPEHEQRENGKRTVDGVVTTEEQLAVDVEILDRTKESSGEQCGKSNATPAHRRQRYELKHQRKDTSGHNRLDHPRNHRGAVVDQREMRKIVEQFQHNDPHAAEKEDGKDEKHDESEVGQRETEQTARSVNAPHGIKSAFDVVDERNEGKGQDKEADSDHHIVLCARNVGVGKVHELAYDVIGQT